MYQPDFLNRNRLVIAIGLLLVLATTAVRFAEWPAWLEAGTWLNGSPILASNDGYAWLAGTQPEGRMHGWPMARLIAILAAILPFSAAQVAFFLPAALASVPALAVLLLARMKELTAAALPAGVLASCGMAFLLRTRLGYPETELFALPAVLGLAIVWALAVGLSRHDRGGIDWRWVGVACGWASLAVWAYPSAHPLLMAILPAGALGWFLAGGRSTTILPALAAVAVSMHWGPIGLALGAGLCLFAARSPFAHRPALGLTGAGLLALAILLLDSERWLEAIHRLTSYAGWLPPEGDWLLPDVAASVRETTRSSPSDYFLRLAGHGGWVVTGLAGYGWLVSRRPEWLAFAPLLLLGLAGYWLGPRFAMYATPVIGIGLGFGLATWLSKQGYRPRWQWAAQSLLAACLLATTLWYARTLEPGPVLPPDHARALQQLAPASRQEGGLPARVWEWWDLGYAAQFFTRLPSFSDGGSTSRRHAFMLGKVLGAESPADAAAWMRLGAAERQTANTSIDRADQAPYAHRPLSSVEELDASAAIRVLADEVERLREGPAETLPDEYLVVSWHALRRAEWISRFSRWDLAEGDGGHGRSHTLQPPVSLDEQAGVLDTLEGPVRLASLSILQEGRNHHRSWTSPDGVHAVINNESGEGVLLDADLYGMMAVQMLINSPEQFDDQFELVVDAFPHARVYRLR